MEKEYIYPYFQNLSSGENSGGADVSGVTATAGDVDEGKIFVNSSGEEVEGTSTYKADYTALNTLVGQTTAVAGDVDSGKYFVGADGTQKTGSSTAKADLASLTQTVNTANNNLEATILGSGSGGGLTVDEVKGLIDGAGTSFTIPQGTTSIRNYAFYNAKNLTTLSMPNNITSIGNYAFYGCSKLALTSLPSGVTSIGERAFSDCSKLALTSLPSGVTEIKGGTFFQSGITSVIIPQGVTSIANDAFAYCSSLTTVTFEGTPTIIASSVFNMARSLATIYVPWAEGVVSGAPWGATRATIIYNHTS